MNVQMMEEAIEQMKRGSELMKQARKEIDRLRESNKALLEEAKEARTLLNHLIKFLKFQRPGKEFYPNREAGEACILRLETLIAKAEGKS
jgi:methyl-accepting chemotaxis protein